MTRPVHGVLNSIPQIINVKISYKRLERLAKELEYTNIEEILGEPYNNIVKDGIELELTNVE